MTAHQPLMLPEVFLHRKMLVIQITPTRMCNLRCTHCFITNEHKAIREVMAVERYKQAMLACIRYAELVPVEEIEIVVFGGELHLLDAAYLREIFTFTADVVAETAARDGGRKLKVVTSSITTNLIGIRQDKLDLFVECAEYFNRRHADLGLADMDIEAAYEFATSYEPDTNRFHKPRILEDWKRNTRWLAERASVGVAVTGTRGLVRQGAKAMIDLLVRDLGVSVAFDYFAPYGEAKNYAGDLEPDYDELVAFMQDLLVEGDRISREFGKWMVTPMPSREIALENLNSRWLTIVSVDYDGGIFLDSESAADNQFNHSVPGYVADGDIEVIARNLLQLAQKKWRTEYKQMIKTGCLDCRHVSYCQGGYFHFFEKYNDGDRCPGLMPVMDLYRDLADGHPEMPIS